MTTNSLRERAFDTMNGDRLNEIYKCAYEQGVGCFFFAPLNIYTSQHKLLPRDIVGVIKNSGPSLNVGVEEMFDRWKVFLPYLNLKIKAVKKTTPLTILGRSIEEVIHEAGFNHVDIEDVQDQSDISLSPELSWILVMCDDSVPPKLHAISNRESKIQDNFYNVGGVSEFNHYLSEGWKLCLLIGLENESNF